MMEFVNHEFIVRTSIMFRHTSTVISMRHLFALLMCLLLAGLAGCQGNKGPLRQAQQQPAEKRSRADVVGVTTSIADAYVITVLQGLDELRDTAEDDKIQKWAAENKLATAIAVYTSASSPNDMANLFDLLTYATLKR